jgi:hypothetical protein
MFERRHVRALEVCSFTWKQQEVREPATNSARPQTAVISEKICRLLPLAKKVCEERRRLAFAVHDNVFVVFKDINDRHTV